MLQKGLVFVVVVIVAGISGQYHNSLQIRNCPSYCSDIGVCDAEGVCHVRTQDGRFPSQRNLNSFFIPQNEPLQDSVFRVTIEEERPKSYSYNYRSSPGIPQIHRNQPFRTIPLPGTSRVISSRYIGPVANEIGNDNSVPVPQAQFQPIQQQLVQAAQFEFREIPAIQGLDAGPVGPISAQDPAASLQSDLCGAGRGFRCMKFSTPPVSPHCVAFGVQNCLVCNWRGQCVKSADDAWSKFCQECEHLKQGSCDKERRQCTFPRDGRVY